MSHVLCIFTLYIILFYFNSTIVKRPSLLYFSESVCSKTQFWKSALCDVNPCAPNSHWAASNLLFHPTKYFQGWPEFS